MDRTGPVRIRFRPPYHNWQTEGGEEEGVSGNLKFLLDGKSIDAMIEISYDGELKRANALGRSIVLNATERGML